MKERIRQIMNAMGLSQQEFAQRLGISTASISSIFNGRTNPTNNHVMAIHRVFPQIRIEWLMFGEGDMYVAQTPSQDGDASVEGAVPTKAPEAASAGNGAAIDGSSLFGAESVAVIPEKSSNFRPRPSYASERSSTYMNSKEEMRNIIDIPKRKIKEIRVFFDDGTYESFVPSTRS